MRRIPSRERGNYTFRLSPAERAVLTAAADRRPEHLSEYIRRVALRAATAEIGASGDSVERFAAALGA